MNTFDGVITHFKHNPHHHLHLSRHAVNTLNRSNPVCGHSLRLKELSENVYLLPPNVVTSEILRSPTL